MPSTATTRDAHPFSSSTLVPEDLAATPSPAGGATPGALTVRQVPLGRVGGVPLVQWPAEEARREELARAGEPCVLVVPADVAPPRTSRLEDWVREPVDSADLAARCAAVRRRAECGTGPTLDDGLLLHRGAWAAVPPAQLGMVELLLERLGRVVTKEDLAAAAESSGGSGHEDAVKAAMNRLARRINPLGLELRSIRGRGYLLQLRDRCPVHDPVSAANTKDSCL